MPSPYSSGRSNTTIAGNRRPHLLTPAHQPSDYLPPKALKDGTAPVQPVNLNVRICVQIRMMELRNFAAAVDFALPLNFGLARFPGNTRHLCAQHIYFGWHSNMNFFYPTDIFPFTDAVQTDPETGLNDGLLRRVHSSGTAPRIFTEDFVRQTGLRISLRGPPDAPPYFRKEP